MIQVARLETGHTPSRRNPEYWDGDVPWLSLKDIRGLEGNYVIDTADMPTMQGINNSSARVLPKGTVALCRTASVGKAVILGRDMATSQDFVNWVCGPELLPEYLLRALRASSSAFDTEKQGSTHKTIYMPTVSRFHVLLPPLAEQRRIAALLDKADAIRRKRQQAIRLADDLLRSAFLDMFGDSAPRVRLGDHLTFLTSGSRGWAQYYSEEGAPFLRIQNVGYNRLLPADLARVTPPSDAEAARTRVRGGDVLLSITADLGRSAVIPPELEGAYVNQHLAVLRVKGELVPLYLSAYLASPGGQRQVKRLNREGVKAGLNFDDIRSLQVPLPPRMAQERFATALHGVRNLETRSQVAVGHAAQLFHSLAQSAFHPERCSGTNGPLVAVPVP